MIPLTFLYDEYIDRPKLTEQKNPFEYIVPSRTSGVGTINMQTLGSKQFKNCIALSTNLLQLLVANDFHNLCL